jgi:hypothetical protein
MKVMTIPTGVVLAFSATMAVVLGVVCLMMGFNLDAAPGLRGEWPMLLAAAGAFAVATVVAGVAWFSLRRGWALWPVFQGLMWSVVALIGMAIQRGLSG